MFADSCEKVGGVSTLIPAGDPVPEPASMYVIARRWFRWYIVAPGKVGPMPAALRGDVDAETD